MRVLHCLAPPIVPTESVITASLLALVLLFSCFPSSWGYWATLSAGKRRHVLASSLSVVQTSEVYLQSFLKLSEL